MMFYLAQLFRIPKSERNVQRNMERQSEGQTIEIAIMMGIWV